MLDIAGVTCNKNAIPFDTTSPLITSGIRMGTPACTTRGFMEEEWVEVADIISEILESAHSPNAEDFAIGMKHKVKELCSKFPIY